MMRLEDILAKKNVKFRLFEQDSISNLTLFNLTSVFFCIEALLTPLYKEDNALSDFNNLGCSRVDVREKKWSKKLFFHIFNIYIKLFNN